MKNTDDKLRKKRYVTNSKWGLLPKGKSYNKVSVCQFCKKKIYAKTWRTKCDECKAKGVR